MKYLGYCKNKFVQKILILRTKNYKLSGCSQHFDIVNTTYVCQKDLSHFYPISIRQYKIIQDNRNGKMPISRPFKTIEDNRIRAVGSGIVSEINE